MHSFFCCVFLLLGIDTKKLNFLLKFFLFFVRTSMEVKFPQFSFCALSQTFLTNELFLHFMQISAVLSLLLQNSFFSLIFFFLFFHWTVQHFSFFHFFFFFLPITLVSSTKKINGLLAGLGQPMLWLNEQYQWDIGPLLNQDTQLCVDNWATRRAGGGCRAMSHPIFEASLNA